MIHRIFIWTNRTEFVQSIAAFQEIICLNAENSTAQNIATF